VASALGYYNISRGEKGRKIGLKLQKATQMVLKVHFKLPFRYQRTI
jgi:hypothetical protein